jgi:uncharacterized protein
VFDLPELSFNRDMQWIRVPPELDVPVTRRVKSILDSSAMRRLGRISQLGLVGLVYPGATHSRLEHSLGVYRLAVQVLAHLARDSEFVDQVDTDDAKVFLIAALVHDIAHWPYCHPLEDMRLDWIPQHEQLARQVLCEGELAGIIRREWQVEPEQVADFLAPQDATQVQAPALLHSLLSGPIDIDKMDYLQRDSLHAGVPYGRNFDVGRLINSLVIGPNATRAAITEKGKTAAEMMVFARYVMFSEVYWHHAVRSATAMLQRSVFELSQSGTEFMGGPHVTDRWLNQTDAEFADALIDATSRLVSVGPMVVGLFGRQRRLYKRLAQFNFTENAEVHRALARRPYHELVECAARLSERLSRYSDQPLNATDVLIDAPPVKLEVQFKLDVRLKAAAVEGREAAGFQPLTDISPVVRSLATEQFDNFVKRVRVFVAPEFVSTIRIAPEELTQELLLAATVS